MNKFLFSSKKQLNTGLKFDDNYHCFATVSKKSCSMIELIRSESEVATLVALLRNFRFWPLVCCLVTLSQMAAKKGVKSSNEKMLVMVNWGSPSLRLIG